MFVSRVSAGKGRAVLEGVGLAPETVRACYGRHPGNEEEAVQEGLIDNMVRGSPRQDLHLERAPWCHGACSYRRETLHRTQKGAPPTFKVCICHCQPPTELRHWQFSTLYTQGEISCDSHFCTISIFCYVCIHSGTS